MCPCLCAWNKGIIETQSSWSGISLQLNACLFLEREIITDMRSWWGEAAWRRGWLWSAVPPHDLQGKLAHLKHQLWSATADNLNDMQICNSYKAILYRKSRRPMLTSFPPILSILSWLTNAYPRHCARNDTPWLPKRASTENAGIREKPRVLLPLVFTVNALALYYRHF